MIATLEDLATIRSDHQAEKLVLTSGTFDMFHIGHLRYLQAAMALGDVVVVLMSGDDRAEARKGSGRPHIPETDRAEIVANLRGIHSVLIDPATARPDEIDPVHAEIVALLQPDIYATDGPDSRFAGIMDESKLIILPCSNESTSTTAIEQRIKSL